MSKITLAFPFENKASLEAIDSRGGTTLMAIVKEDIITKYQIHENDRGSAPVQVAILTARILSLIHI